MNKTTLHDIQKTLNIIRNQIDAADADTKWAALELMLASSASVVALAKKMAKPDTKTVTRKISIPKPKSSRSLLNKQANLLRTTQFELLTKPSLLKSRYPINKSVNKRLKNAH
jgi:hypothetical protein